MTAVDDNDLSTRWPVLGHCLPRASLSRGPTPVEWHEVSVGGRQQTIAVKRDDLTGSIYGGNKVRKLEYVLRRALDRGAARVATFGAAGSNHALATALYAQSLGLGCTCFLGHQPPGPGIRLALARHHRLGSRIVLFGGARASRIAILREQLSAQRHWLIPAGGSSWLGAVGFVNAGLEFAAQWRASGRPDPARLYVANGTMGTAAGLALGLAAAGFSTELHAIRVTEPPYSSEAGMQRLMHKINAMLARLDPAVPTTLAARSQLVFRNGFLAGGYGRVDSATSSAVAFAADALKLKLETTYTGKAFCALLADAASVAGDVVFWNTYNSRPVAAAQDEAEVMAGLPAEFRRYFD